MVDAVAPIQRENFLEQLQMGNEAVQTEIDILNAALVLQNIYNDKISLMDLHFKYTVNGIGFQDAKTDFINKCIQNI